MTTNRTDWNDLVCLLKKLDRLHIDIETEGRFSLLSRDDVELLNRVVALSKQQNSDLILEVQGEIAIPHICCITIKYIKPRLGVIKKSVADLITGRQKDRYQVPNRFFIQKNNLTEEDAVDSTHDLAKYKSVVSLIAMLQSAAIFLDKDKGWLVFTNPARFDLPIEYTIDDLRALDTTIVDALKNMPSPEVHKEQFCSILASCIVELTCNQPMKSRFSFLLAHLNDLQEKFDHGWRLFSAGFSYDKVKDQVNTTQIEYSGKIHKVLSDIQNQLLGIPVATIIVATQMKGGAKFPDQNFWVNTAVFFGSVVFTFFIRALTGNQKSTLNTLKDEINRQGNLLKEEYAATVKDFQKTFQDLENKVSDQEKVLDRINFFVTLGLVLSALMYLWLTEPLKTWLSMLGECIKTLNS